MNTVAREGEKRLGEGARELDGRVRELHADTSVELGRLAEAGLELGRRQEWLSGLLTKLIASVDGTENHFDQRAETLTRKAREAGEAMAGAGDLANERAAMLETRLMGLSATTETLVSRLARHLESLEALASQAPTDEEMAADARAAEFLASLAQVGDAVGAMGLDLAQLDADESTDAGFLGKFKRRGAAAAGAGPRLAREYGENAAFRAQADSYLAAFGVFMDGVARDGQGNVTRTLMLGSDVGKLFRLLRRVRDEA